MLLSSFVSPIALFTVTFSHLHYNVFEHGCEAISGNVALLTRNCLTSTFKNIVMQMRKGNCEKGYYCCALGDFLNTLIKFTIATHYHMRMS